jgi:peroxiredoxin (alkyl hydroperoxide reductase subunit C)
MRLQRTVEGHGRAQLREEQQAMSVLVNKPAPDFSVDAVLPDGSIETTTLSQFRGKYVVLFFYPFDFTFVCPTEIIAFDRRLDEFAKRNVQVLGASIDSVHSHWAWRQMKVKDGGIGEVRYPLLSDVNKTIARDYDVLLEGGMALRGSFLIDRDGKVQHQVVNNLPLGRDIDEMLRMIDALQFTEVHGEVCPAGWSEGKPGMKDTHEGVADFLSKNARRL